MLIYLTNKEFTSYDSIPSYRSCCVGDIRLSKGDDRVNDLCGVGKYQIMVVDPIFRGSIVRGVYLFSDCCSVAWGSSIQINYWGCEKLGEVDIRDRLIDIICYL